MGIQAETPTADGIGGMLCEDSTSLGIVDLIGLSA